MASANLNLVRSIFAHRTGRGKTSGLELEQMRSETASLVHVRDGKVTRLVFHADEDQALADVGLAPEPGTSQP